MTRTRVAFVLCLALIAGAASTIEAGRGRNPRPNVVIDLAEITYDAGVPVTIILRGDRFRVPGRILLDGAELHILSWDNKTIEAELPAWVVAATYRVTVTRGAASIDNFSMDVAIGAIGAQGPDGPEGPQGPAGPPGVASFYSRGAQVTLAAPELSLAAQADCDAGDAVVGGGISYIQGGTQPQIIVKQTSSSTMGGTGWYGEIGAATGSAGFDTGTVLAVSAMCADLTP